MYLSCCSRSAGRRNHALCVSDMRCAKKPGEGHGAGTGTATGGWFLHATRRFAVCVGVPSYGELLRHLLFIIHTGMQDADYWILAKW